MLLHWLIAIAVIVNWRLAEAAHEGPRGSGSGLMATHKAIGMTILALTVLRIVWRLVHRPPPMAEHLATWERGLAHAVHAIFYILLIALPLGAWIASSLGGKGVDMFGLFTIPPLPLAPDKQLGHEIYDIHGTAGTIMIWLIGLHILGALKHTFWDRDGDLFRMLPFGRVKA